MDMSVAIDRITIQTDLFGRLPGTRGGRTTRQFAWLLHESSSLLSMLEPNVRPLDYLHATRRKYGLALPF
jgi:hypothetical protein